MSTGFTKLLLYFVGVFVPFTSMNLELLVLLIVSWSKTLIEGNKTPQTIPSPFLAKQIVVDKFLFGRFPDATMDIHGTLG